MSRVKCPDCGSTKLEQLDANRYQCPYCGAVFTPDPPQPNYHQPPYQQPVPQQPVQPPYQQPVPQQPVLQQPVQAGATTGSENNKTSSGCVLPVVGVFFALLLVLLIAATQCGGSDSDSSDEAASAAVTDTMPAGVDSEASRIEALKARDAAECQQIISRLTSEIVNIKTWSGGKSCKMRKTPVSYREYDAVVLGYFSDDAQRYAPLEHDYATFTTDEIVKFFECFNAATGGNYRAPSYVEDSDAGDAYGLIEVYDAKRKETMMYSPSGTAYHGESGSYGSYYFRIATDWD